MALSSGEIAGPVVEGRNMFQSPQVFVDGKGSKGLQEQVLLDERGQHHDVFAYRAAHAFSIVAKAIIQAYYGLQDM